MTTTDTQVTRPPGTVTEKIVRWDEVRDGDDVLDYAGRLGTATVLPLGSTWCPPGRASVCIDGSWYTPPRDRLTAVRRYGTGSPAAWTGGHALLTEHHGETVTARCQCGEPLGQSDPATLPDFGRAWEQHMAALDD